MKITMLKLPYYRQKVNKFNNKDKIKDATCHKTNARIR